MNSKQRGNVPAPIEQQPQRDERELHPNARDAIAKYNAVWEDNDRLTADNANLRRENEVLRRTDEEKVKLIDSLRRTMESAQQAADQRLREADERMRALDQMFTERLAESERSKERYLRYAVEISTRLEEARACINSAHEAAMEIASAPDRRSLKDLEGDLEKLLQENWKRGGIDESSLPS